MDIEALNNAKARGERFRKAREIKGWRWKDLANAFDTSVDTIVKWQQRGISKRKLAAVAKHFGVDQSVFSDMNISEADFEMMIRESIEGGVLKKVIYTYQGNADGRLIQSPTFNISKTVVLLKATVWGVEGQTFSQFILTDANHNQPLEGSKGSAMIKYTRGDLPVLRVITRDDAKAEDMNSGLLLRERLKEGDFYISIHSPKDFRVVVFDIEI